MRHMRRHITKGRPRRICQTSLQSAVILKYDEKRIPENKFDTDEVHGAPPGLLETLIDGIRSQKFDSIPKASSKSLIISSNSWESQKKTLDLGNVFSIQSHKGTTHRLRTPEDGCVLHSHINITLWKFKYQFAISSQPIREFNIKIANFVSDFKAS